ncbi:uncharacterized protein [Elaeis guineensis]|uniref:Cilia- and flagella-associated protein 251 n=1 Tax=Elaeis guineensis var. tenera TaxID=51953 RepID=A0A6I9QUV9_ELAGV|nr:cilia- and flagella-associated protein 251 [Elaeis guineensis]
MATGVKEVRLKEKGISAPLTPRRVLLSHGGQTIPNGDIPMAKEKPMPNYLKPTLSSCHDTSCSYPKSQQQHAEDSIASAGARKRLISVKSMEKPASPSSPDKTPKGRASRTDLSPKAALSPKVVPEKASKAPTVGKNLARAKSFPKRREANGTPSTTSAIKPEQEEKVLFIDSGVQGHAARHGSQAPKSNTEGRNRTSLEESDTGKPRAPPGKLSKKVCGNEGAPKKLRFRRGREGDGKDAVLGERLKFQQREKVVEVAGEGKAEQENVVLKRQEVRERGAPPAYNDVIEETAAKLATRRNKVRALVGAFESVISLQEPETQPSQRQQVAAVKVASDEPAQLMPEVEEVKIGEDGAERGQQQPEEEKDEIESGEEETKGCQSVQESPQKETEEEEESGGEDCGQLDQESQHKETRATGEEGDGVEEDGSNVTKE